MSDESEKSALPEMVAAGDVIPAVQICPFGDYPNGKTLQRCDARAFRRLS